jgi:hypothetical protein
MSAPTAALWQGDEQVADNKDVPSRTDLDDQIDAKEAWDKPSITSYLPANAAEGLAYNPLDGVSNLTA